MRPIASADQTESSDIGNGESYPSNMPPVPSRSGTSVVHWDRRTWVMSRVARARHVACPDHANALSTPYVSQASLTIMQSVTSLNGRCARTSACVLDAPSPMPVGWMLQCGCLNRCQADGACCIREGCCMPQSQVDAAWRMECGRWNAGTLTHLVADVHACVPVAVGGALMHGGRPRSAQSLPPGHCMPYKMQNTRASRVAAGQGC
jgi:hypothetical protein